MLILKWGFFYYAAHQTPIREIFFRIRICVQRDLKIHLKFSRLRSHYIVSYAAYSVIPNCPREFIPSRNNECMIGSRIYETYDPFSITIGIRIYNLIPVYVCLYMKILSASRGTKDSRVNGSQISGCNVFTRIIINNH